MSSRKADASQRAQSARDRLEAILDPGWRLLFEDVVSADPLGFPGYGEQLARARSGTAASEAVLVADGAVDGCDCVAIAFEFGFLGGSMGAATGERIARAFELAADARIPVFAFIATGGARMQEGMASLAQMPATIVARRLLAEADQPFVAWLGNPTTGGVYASVASLADLVWAEPRATIGFAGPRVAEAMTGEQLPEDSHTAEAALAAGLIDEIVPLEQLRARCTDVVRLLDGRAMGPLPVEPAGPTDDAERDPWERVALARAAARPTGTDYLPPVLVLRRGGTGDGVRCGVGKLGSSTVVAIAQDRRAGHTTPSGYRRARHAIGVACRLGVPVVTFVDTPGADPSEASERDGIAREIALTLDALLAAPVPTVACVVGEGGSGGALAFAACDRVLIQTNAIFSVIAPEGAASILRRDDVDEVARDLRVTAADLLALDLADAIVPEPADGATADPDAARALVWRAVALALGEAVTEGAPTPRRPTRWRAHGRTL
ncbi:MAG TPA: carboxyl transferase domain-containing protein [Actinomycetota bacterium]